MGVATGRGVGVGVGCGAGIRLGAREAFAAVEVTRSGGGFIAGADAAVVVAVREITIPVQAERATPVEVMTRISHW